MRKEHKHECVNTGRIEVCTDTECKKPYRIIMQPVKSKRVKSVKSNDAMHRYAKLVYDSDKF